MSKIDENKDLLLEINISESPLFNFGRAKKTVSAKKLLESNANTEQLNEVLNYLTKKEDKQVEYRKWTDSKGEIRELVVASLVETPNAFCVDVFMGLVKLMMKDNSPLLVDDSGKCQLKSNKVDFTLNELCEAMEINRGGNTYRRIKDALRTLKTTTYFSIGSGCIYDKRIGKYETRTESAISLIEGYDTSQVIHADSTKEKGELIKGYVKFGDLVMNNLENGFFRVVRNHQFFQLKSGYTRGLYLYIQGNITSKDVYLKRSYDVLKNKIPLDFTTPSKLKEKLKSSLGNLIDAGVITDYMYGDEFKVNGVKEQCIYFIFKGTKIDLIKKLEEDYNKKHSKSKNDNKKEELEDKFELVFPEDIQQELLNFGVNEVKVQELVRKHSKYKLAEYILWLQDGISKGKVKDPAGLFVFAITDEKVKVVSSHPQITEFVEKIKNEADGKNAISKELIDKAYKKYIEKEFDLFEKDDEFMFMSMKSTVLDDIEKVKDKKIKLQRQLYNMATKPDEKDKLLKNIEKWEKFSVEREKSELFIEMFVKSVKLYRGLKDYEEFKQSYKDSNR